MTDLISRTQILSAARNWIGTPYRHQTSCKGAGTDCLGLVRGVWREVYGIEPLAVPPYTPDWAEKSGSETLLKAARHCLVEIDNRAARPGDVMLFRMSAKGPCKHVAIMSGPTTMIHAYWGRAVTESHVVAYWAKRWAYSFSFPDLET